MINVLLSKLKLNAQKTRICCLVSGKLLAPVVQKVGNAIHRINHYPVVSVACLVNIYLLDSDLSGG